jgi:hypothetical protein
MTVIEIEHGRQDQAKGKQIKGAAGDLQRGSLEGIDITRKVAFHSINHMPYADSRYHLDKGIDPETEQGESLVFEAEKYGYEPFQQIVEDGDLGQQDGRFVKSAPLAI